MAVPAVPSQAFGDVQRYLRQKRATGQTVSPREERLAWQAYWDSMASNYNVSRELGLREEQIQNEEDYRDQLLDLRKDEIDNAEQAAQISGITQLAGTGATAYIGLKGTKLGEKLGLGTTAAETAPTGGGATSAPALPAGYAPSRIATTTTPLSYSVPGQAAGAALPVSPAVAETLPGTMSLSGVGSALPAPAIAETLPGTLSLPTTAPSALPALPTGSAVSAPAATSAAVGPSAATLGYAAGAAAVAGYAGSYLGGEVAGRKGSAVGSAGAGLAAGAIVGGPVGAVIGGVVGGLSSIVGGGKEGGGGLTDPEFKRKQREQRERTASGDYRTQADTARDISRMTTTQIGLT